ncbi:methionyl-tRNA formyltransferase [Phocicoccus pinnipedialis]|uniref:Methionyl-tRNA formyltransferase n=1 Tax=Phocicoccus pinnipedialis TaxID=110845 RepID=A0A6V7RGS8_9BACL|nr:methionyl-tRNA formyltransferase [Jeotgalicoccus pinnipedialis]MBP1939064.1 methionyl-tRNA formyltransferase [Jeotgalicoccus pinnipedialis]CAD2076955.1 Methionyl-tRNA formyltransferase [Jeotgalicoccus pinnipedialis]
MTKIIFMGTPDFSVPILEAVHKEYEIDLVISQPDRPVGRKRVMTAPPVVAAAKELGISVYQPENVSKDGLETIEQMKPDLIITAAYGQLLSEAILQAPRLGAINVHASLLPKHRGGAPIHRSIIEGDEKTGVSIMYMEKTLDSGDVIAQKEVAILNVDNVGTLHDKLSTLGRDLLLEVLPSILNSTNDRTPQNHDEATFSPNISKNDEYIDFDRSARDVFNHIRGLNPFPGGYTKLDGKRLKLYNAKFTDEKTTEPAGKILEITEDGFMVATKDELLLITEVQPAGKKRIQAVDFINNNPNLVGLILGA